MAAWRLASGFVRLAPFQVVLLVLPTMMMVMILLIQLAIAIFGSVGLAVVSVRLLLLVLLLALTPGMNRVVRTHGLVGRIVVPKHLEPFAMDILLQRPSLLVVPSTVVVFMFLACGPGRPDSWFCGYP